MSNHILRMESTGDPKDTTVTIKLSHYDEILKASLKLQALEINGVDNWEWYGESLTTFKELLKDRGFEVEE